MHAGVPSMHSASDTAAASSASSVSLASGGSTNSPESVYSNKMWINYNRDKQSNSLDASVIITNKNENNNDDNKDDNGEYSPDHENENGNGNDHHSSGHRARNGGLQCDPDTDNTATFHGLQLLQDMLNADG